MRRQVVVEPEDDALDDRDVQRAFRAVLRRHGRAFTKLAEYDRGEGELAGREAQVSRHARRRRR